MIAQHDIGRSLADRGRLPRAFTPDAFNPIDLSPGRVLSSQELFFDAFTAATLNTARWTRTESSAGNVEIEAANDRLKLFGNGTFADNGLMSANTFAKVVGLTFQCDFLRTDANSTGLMIGFQDGAGLDFTDYAHGMDIYNAGTNVHIFENGNSRGDVGGMSIPPDLWHRVRIRITSSTAASYQIQGFGFGHFGTTSFTTLSPSSTSSASDPLRVACSVQHGSNHWIRNVMVYLS